MLDAVANAPGVDQSYAQVEYAVNQRDFVFWEADAGACQTDDTFHTEFFHD